MKIAIYDEEGEKIGILDTDKAECLVSTHWVAGVSKSRGTDLYKTEKGKYILLDWTNWQGEQDTAKIATEEEARDFAHSHGVFDAFPPTEDEIL